jgi:hypothetical protein
MLPQRFGLLLFVACLCCLFHAGSAATLAADDDADFFETQIRPLLAEHCVGCHGPRRQEGGLRLDSRAAVLKGGDSGAAAIAKDPGASRMLKAVRYDGDLQMPPDGRLPESAATLLQHWIERGLPWPESGTPLQADAASTHWAFQPIHNPEIPVVNGVTTQNPIDAFINQRLQREGLAMSAEADRRALLRRVWYSTTGLPPSHSDVERFAFDPDPQAWEKVVDQLLASRAHAEHWARHWLDIARYSDTKGYVYAREERFWVHAWNYRDWVIQSLSEDMPYNRFLLLQLAADQVVDSRPDDLAAMGFLTVGRRFLGVRRDIIDDQIDVVCRGTMALTVGCARCHDHKYDPIPTADYYSLYGVFDSSREALVPLTNAEGASEEFLTSWQKKATDANSVLQERRAATAARLSRRVADYLSAQLDLSRYPEAGFDQILSSSDLLPTYVHRWRDVLQLSQRSGEPVFAAWHMFRAIPAVDFPASAAALHQSLLELPDERLNTRVRSVFATAPASMAEVVQRYGELFRTVDMEWQSLQLQTKSAGQPAPLQLPDASSEALRQVLYSPSGPCYVPDEPVMSTEYDFDTGTCNELWKQQVELERMILGAASQPRFAVVLRDRAVPVEPRVFLRGDPARRGDPVPRQFLSLLSGPGRRPFTQGSGRLELAQAIIDPANPLTARVIVNRVWAQHFGAGLVGTPGDFGLRSEAPSHPELLDWLASWFVREGWSLRKLHRLLLTSAAYRQKSTGPEDSRLLETALSRDPANRLLWRMNSHRLSFEEMRDSMLTAAGRLDPTPAGRAQDLFKAPYPRRRTIYGLVDRQFLPGTLRIFDFANPDLHIPQRSETTVPQQALFLMNHPLVLEQVRELARAVEAGGADEGQRVRQLFQRTLQRAPRDEELAASLQLFLQPVTASAPPSATAADWSYGYGKVDEAAGRVMNFRPLPHFTGTAWQGGSAFPDSNLGWVQLTAAGGHPGNDRDHACVRRWTAPRAMTLSVRSKLVHEPEPGDGIRAFLVSSRSGILTKAVIHKQQHEPASCSFQVEAGETLDFVVDIGEQLNSDQFLWSIELREAGAAEQPVVWSSTADFPRAPSPELTPLQQLAQVLLVSNEFLFVD